MTTAQSNQTDNSDLQFPPLSSPRQSPTKIPVTENGHTGLSEEEEVAAASVHVGDRVVVRGTSRGGLTQQHKGLVKFVGRVDAGTPDFGLHVGLKMDDPSEFGRGPIFFHLTQKYKLTFIVLNPTQLVTQMVCSWANGTSSALDDTA